MLIITGILLIFCTLIYDYIVPASPVFQGIIPTYKKESKLLINAEVTFADVVSYKTSNIESK